MSSSDYRNVDIAFPTLIAEKWSVEGVMNAIQMDVSRKEMHGRFKHRPACSDQDFKVHIVRYWNSDIVVYYQLFCYYMAVEINKSILISFVIISLTLIWSVPEHISPGGITFTFVIKVITLIFSNIFEMTLTGGKPALIYHYYIYYL